jgi:hypothetical protein
MDADAVPDQKPVEPRSAEYPGEDARLASGGHAPSNLFVDGDLLNLKSAAANGLTGTGEGSPRSQ